MRHVLWVFAKDMRLRIRDRSAILIAVVAPFAIASIVGLALGSTQDFSTTLAYANLSPSELTSGLTEVLESPELRDTAEVEGFDTAAAAEAAVADGDAGAGIIVPEDFTENATAGRPAEITVVTDVSSPLAASIAEGISSGYLSRIQAGTVAVATVTAIEGRPPSDPAAIARTAASDLGEVRYRADDAARQLRPIDYFAPSMGILFLFFTVLYGATTLHAERRDRTFARLAVSPASPSSVLVGKLLTVFTIGVVEMVVIIVSTTLVYDVPWGRPSLVAVLVLTTVFAAIGLTGTVIVFARTEEQSRQFGSVVIVVFTLLGGQWTFGALPGALTALQEITPNGQALIGFTDLMVQGGSATFGTIAAPVAVTLAYGAVGFAIASVRARAVFFA